MVNFLKPWCGIANYVDNILIYLQKNNVLPLGLNASLDLPSKAERKATFKAFKTSKKLKYMDDPKVAKKTRLTILRDKWLIAYGKPTPEIKARMKKIAETEKKKLKKKIKLGKKAKEKAKLWTLEN